MAQKYCPQQPEFYLPLQKLDKCTVCQNSGIKLFTCGSCAEAIYCSQECQKKDWKSHKVHCGETDRIDLQSFYPLVAAIQWSCRAYPDSIKHPALSHKILNSPNPGSSTDIVQFPNGISAKLVLLGDKVDQETVGLHDWWPTALSPPVRRKLCRRVMGEGLLLPIVLATTIAMVAEIYTTTAIPQSEEVRWQVTNRRRVRLQYHRSPIADIGIAKGTCTRVTPEDRLAYYKIDTNEFLMGADPTDHYWMYFKTLNGHEYFLDCGMYTFNFTISANIDEYVKHVRPTLMGSVPAFFYGRELQKRLPLTGRVGWTPDKRFSILRNPDLVDILRTWDRGYCDCHDIPTLSSLMDKIAGRTCTPWEKEMMMKFLENNCMTFRMNLHDREYLRFPKEPLVGLDLDPDESINAVTAQESQEDEACEKYLKKWTRRLKKGQITAKQWEDAFNAWDANRHDIVRKMAQAGKLSTPNYTTDTRQQKEIKKHQGQ